MKKILSIALVVVLLAGIAVSGTMAYLTDTDSAVNVMTLGNVKIKQHEKERAVKDGMYETDEKGYVLTDFTQDKPLYPAVGETAWDGNVVDFDQLGEKHYNEYMNVFDEAKFKNAQDKFVFVENTGKSDAYVRTIVAFEVGNLAEEKIESLLGYGYHSAWTLTELGTVSIDGNTYFIVDFVFDKVVEPGYFTPCSLSQVYLSKDATNEDVEAIDGNKNDKYDIIVLSQAVQTAGFADAKTALDEAFGEATLEQAKAWFENSDAKAYAGVEDAAGLNEAFTEGGSVMLKNDITGDSFEVAEDKKVDVNLNDKKLEGDNIVNKGDLNLSDGTVKADYVQNNGNATYTDVDMEAGTATDYANISNTGSETVYNNVDITSGGGGIGAVGGAKVTFNSGSVAINATTTNPRYNVYAVGTGTEVTINGGEFSFTTPTLRRAYIYAGAGTTVYVNGGTFGKASTRSGYTAGILGDGTVIIKGGTFGFDPSAWVADGYQAVKTGDNWVVSAK